MAHNVVEFWAYHSNVPRATTQYTELPKQPFGATIATGSALGIEVMFVSSGYDGSATYLGLEKWLLAARYSSTNNVSSTSSHQIATRLGYAGSAASRLLYNLSLSISSGTPRLAWVAAADGCRWTIRGQLWVASST